MSKVAAVQMVSTPVVKENMVTAAKLIAEAADKGAELVLLPEYWSAIGRQDIEKLDDAEPYGKGPIQDFMAETARKHNVWLIGGTLSLVSPEPGKVLNTTLVYSPEGSNVARYDKIHLFGFSTEREAYDESAVISRGSSVATFEAPFGKVGLSVCYDLRFPELYRALGDCCLMVVPAAFTYTTGQVHWEILLRARAIENQTYILAAAQGGRHPTGRRTWGHSMLIDPWGQIRSVCVEGEGLAIGDVDARLLSSIREKLPALKHRRL